MEIQLHNIGIIEESTIKLDGLTVITGKNQTGKTTVGKALYALTDSVSNLTEKVKDSWESYISQQLSKLTSSSNIFRSFRLYRSQIVHSSNRKDINALDGYPALQVLSGFSTYFYFDAADGSFYEQLTREARSELLKYQSSLGSNWEHIKSNSALKDYIAGFTRTNRKVSNEELIEAAIKSMDRDIAKDIQFLDNLMENIEHKPNELSYAQEFVNISLNKEFLSQIQPVGKGAELSKIGIQGEDFQYMNVTVRENQILNCNYFKAASERIFFVDDPLIMDRVRYSENSPILNSHQTDDRLNFYFNTQGRHIDNLNHILSKTLSMDVTDITERIILGDKLRLKKEVLDKVLPGVFDVSLKGEFYIDENGNRLRIPNLAAGSKMFAIIKILLEHGLLDESTILILDEPEIHLHPEWQIQFAEIIVLLVKELHVKVLLTTHSSDFMLAIDAYMRKHAINELCNFYQAKKLENGMVTHECVNENIEVIYQDFLGSFSQTKALRDRYVIEYEEDNEGEDVFEK